MTFVTVAQPGLERSAFNRVAGGSNPPQDTSASGECVGVTLSNYSPIATLLNDNMKLNTSVFGMPLM